MKPSARPWIGIAAGAAVVAVVVGVLVTRESPSTSVSAPAKSAERRTPSRDESPFEARDRARRDPDDPQPAVDDSPRPIGAPMDRPPQAAPAAEAAAPPPPPLTEAAARAKASADTAVAAVRNDMRAKCWDGLAGERPASVEVGFSLTVDAEGKVLSSSVNQSRDHHIPELGTCLAQFAHGLDLAAPGQTVSVDVSFALP
jgi:hypothetical protein